MRSEGPEAIRVMTLSMDGLRTEVFDGSGLVLGLMRRSTALDEQPDGTVLLHRPDSSKESRAVLFEPDHLEKLRDKVLTPHNFGPDVTTGQSASGDKTCPACAESIKSAAVICKHCGYDFGTRQIPGRQGQSRVNGSAVTSLVVGILWLYGVGSILAIVFGYVARSQIDRGRGTQTGRGLATAGLVLGWIGVGFIVILLLALRG